MSDTEYGAALKLGKKQYQDSVAKGEYPYLPVLDEALSYTEIVSQVSLGTMDIPLSKLVGTKTAERSISFANNFIPFPSLLCFYIVFTCYYLFFFYVYYKHLPFILQDESSLQK